MIIDNFAKVTIMTKCRLFVISIVTLMICASPAFSLTDEKNVSDYSVKVLFEQAAFWESRHRGDLGRSALNRIIASQPKNTRALYELGVSHAKEGDIEQARVTLKRINAADPKSIYVSLLNEHIKYSTFDKARLDRARKLSQNGEAEKAIEEYEYMFQGRDKQGLIAIEMYHTMSSIPGRWNEAVAGLKSMLAKEKSNKDAKFALAQILTYKQKTRRQGLNMLREISKDPAYREQAIDKYGEALVWLQATTSDKHYYLYYVKNNPTDDSVNNKLMSLGTSIDPGSYDGLIVYGFQAINNNQLDKASRLFRQATSYQNSTGEEYAGLAVIAQRRGLHDKSIDLYTRALRQTPALRDKYSYGLNSARFWHGINTVRSGKYKKQPENALRRLDKLVPQTKDETLELALVRAEVMYESGNIEQSVNILEKILQQSSDNERAIIRMIDLALVTKDYRKLASLHADHSRKLDNPKTSSALSISLLRAKAVLATNRGQHTAAVAAYDKAISIDENATWLRLDYARLLLSIGEDTQAEIVASKIPVYGAAMKDGNHAKALYYLEVGAWESALATVDMLPVSMFDEELKQIRTIAEFRRDIDNAVSQGELRGAKVAEKSLIALYETAPKIPDRAILIVSALQKFDLHKPSIAIIRQALRDNSKLSINTKLTFSRYLVSWSAFDLADRLITSLDSNRDLNASQQLDLSKLKIHSLQEKARNAMDEGAFSRAYVYLETALQQDTKNTITLRMLGQVSQLQGSLVKSIQYYREAIDVQPNDLWAIKGAVGSALESGNLNVSREVLDDAIDELPNEPEVYDLLARVAQSAGETKMALEAIAYARSLRNQ